jgi:hypothetical protein
VTLAARALARFSAWIDRADEGRDVARFRVAFALVWVVYDALDLALRGTDLGNDPFSTTRTPGLTAIQIGLVVTGVAVALGGRLVYPAGMLYAALRAEELFHYYDLNDYAFGAVTMLLLAHAEGGPLSRGRPSWVRDALRVELAWVYFATAALKMSSAWLGGGEIFVRSMHLSRAHAWPYPGFVLTVLRSRGADGALAWVGLAAELTVAVAYLRPGLRKLGVPLAIALHVFGALAMNVWFFSATMIAAAVTLMPGAAARGASGDDGDSAVAGRDQTPPCPDPPAPPTPSLPPAPPAPPTPVVGAGP